MRKSELELGTEYAIATYQPEGRLPRASKGTLRAINPPTEEWPAREERDRDSARVGRKAADGNVNVTVCLVELPEPPKEYGKERSRMQLRTSRDIWGTWEDYRAAREEKERRSKAAAERRREEQRRLDRIEALLDRLPKEPPAEMTDAERVLCAFCLNWSIRNRTLSRDPALFEQALSALEPYLEPSEEEAAEALTA